MPGINPNRQYESNEIASIYAENRPAPPPELVRSIAEQLGKTVKPDANGHWPLAIDVGCGSGQATFMLADHFEQVIGFDISEAQIAKAKQRNQYSNVTFKVCPGYEIPLENGSVQLITVCQALHFFDIPKFMTKVEALLAPGGLFAAMGYYQVPKLRRLDNPSANLDAIGDLIERAKQLWHDNGYPYIVFTEQLRQKYKHLPLPFEKLTFIDTFKVVIQRPATYIFDLVNSLGPAIQFRADHPEMDKTLMDGIASDLKSILGTNDLASIELEATFEYFILCFKK